MSVSVAKVAEVFFWRNYCVWKPVAVNTLLFCFCCLAFMLLCAIGKVIRVAKE